MLCVAELGSTGMEAEEDVSLLNESEAAAAKASQHLVVFYIGLTSCFLMTSCIIIVSNPSPC